MKKIIIIGISLFFVMSFVCHKRQLEAAKLIYSSQKKKPKWITNPPVATNNELFFIGVKTGADALDEGKKSAVQNAVGEIVEFFGIKAKTRFEEEKNAFSSKIMDQITSQGEAKVSGIRIKEMYYEEWEEGRDKRYDVFILLVYPKIEIKREQERLEAEKNSKKNETQKIFDLATKLEKEGEISAALENYSQARKVLKEIEDAGTLQRTILNRAVEMLGKIKLEVLPYDKKGQTIEGLQNPLSIKATYDVGGGVKIPLKNVPFIFEFIEGNGVLEQKAFSNNDGLVSTRVSQINFPKQTNVVQASIEQDIIPFAQAGNVRFVFSSFGDALPLFEKTYSLSFGRGAKKERIVLYKDDKPEALLNIDISSPGAAEKIVVQIQPLQGNENIDFNEGYTKVEINDAKFIDKREEITFSAKEAKKGKKWTFKIASLKIIAEIVDVSIKEYSNPYTGAFFGFEELQLKVSIF